jgi:CRISPR-associated protein Csm2
MTQSRQQGNHLANADITKPIIDSLSKIDYLKDYPIRDLVTQSETFGKALRDQRLETNQIRKFLDAINRLKSKLVGSGFSEIEAEIVLLKPKLAYAAARQNVVKPLNKVMSAAIDKVVSKADFERLVNLVESIIAYHKEAGGK